MHQSVRDEAGACDADVGAEAGADAAAEYARVYAHELSHVPVNTAVESGLYLRGAAYLKTSPRWLHL